MRGAGILVVAAFALAACGGASDDIPAATETGAAETDVTETDVTETDVTETGADETAAPPEAGGDRLPDVDLTALTTGETSSLADIEGPAVVNLWATWCAPCRAEIPDFEEVHQARGDEVRFVGINVGEDPSVAAEFIAEVGATYDQFADLDGDVSIELRATSMPVTVVIDADGIVTKRHLGPLDQEGLDDAIDEALGISSG